MIEDEMVGWHHRLYGHEFEYALGVGDGWLPPPVLLPEESHGQTSLVSYSP